MGSPRKKPLEQRIQQSSQKIRDSAPQVKKILILTVNPTNTTQLRLDQEFREIQEGLARSQQRDKFQLVQRWAVRPRDIQRAMLDESPQIVHFSGHGQSGQVQGLLLEDESGGSQLVSAEALAGLFSLFADQVQCVVLNACYGFIK